MSVNRYVSSASGGTSWPEVDNSFTGLVEVAELSVTTVHHIFQP